MDKSGRQVRESARALFYSIDEEKKTVTLLVPKTIEFDALSLKSIDKAKRLSRLPQGPATSPEEGTSAEVDHPRDAVSDAELQFLKTHYQEILAFTTKDDFRVNGFAVGGPYNAWFQDVQNARETLLKSPDAAYAGGYLVGLALGYAHANGAETEGTERSRAVIERILSGGATTSEGTKSVGATTNDRTKVTNAVPGAVKWIDGDFFEWIYAFPDLNTIRIYVRGEVPAIFNAAEQRRLRVTRLRIPQKVRIVNDHKIDGVSIYEVTLVDRPSETYFVERVYDTP